MSDHKNCSGIICHGSYAARLPVSYRCVTTAVREGLSHYGGNK